jgi:hypothetical protein
MVFEGGLDTIKKDCPIILCEMMRKWSKVFEYHPNDTIDLLSRIGYQCYKVKNNKLEYMQNMSCDTEEMNFFFLSADKHKPLIERFAE